MKKLILIMFALIMTIGAKAQWIDDGHSFEIDEKYYKKHYGKSNIDTLIRLDTYNRPDGDGRAFKYFLCWRKDTVYDGNTQKIVYKLFQAYCPDFDIFLTKTGTLEELRHWAKYEYKYKCDTVKEVSGEVVIHHTWTYLLDDGHKLYVGGGVQACVKKEEGDTNYHITYNLW